MPLSLGKMKAAEVAWEFALTPKTALVSVSKLPEIVATTPKVLPHVFIRGGVASVPTVLRELSFVKAPVLGGLQSEQIVVPATKIYPALQKLPYIPSLPTLGTLTAKTSTLFAPIAATALIGKPVTILEKPKRKTMPTLIPKLPTDIKTETLFKPIQIFKPTAVTEPKTEAMAIPKTVTIAIPKTIALTKQIQKTSQTTPTIVPPKMPTPSTPTLPYFRIPKGGFDVSGLKAFKLGKWFKRTHPIPTPKQIKTALGLKTDRRKKKRFTFSL